MIGSNRAENCLDRYLKPHLNPSSPQRMKVVPNHRFSPYMSTRQTAFYTQMNIPDCELSVFPQWQAGALCLRTAPGPLDSFRANTQRHKEGAYMWQALLQSGLTHLCESGKLEFGLNPSTPIASFLLPQRRVENNTQKEHQKEHTRASLIQKMTRASSPLKNQYTLDA